ncbi:MAG: MFS transporter [Flavobacteriia bacterium]|nr:MFS transporter [Flavobacteriia bacterium]
MTTYSKDFWRLSFSMLFFMTSFNLILPEMNEYITRIGGADKKGLIITLFTISAAISRPFSGKLSDMIGRKKVMLFGIIISILVCLLYPLFSIVTYFLLLRFIHGFSNGFMPTGATALITDLLPDNKRGQGMGIWGTFISIGIGIGQSSGFIVMKYFSYNELFWLSSILSTISLLLLFPIKETLTNKQKFRVQFLKIQWRDVIEPSVLPAFIVMFLTSSCSGIIFVLSPDFSNFLHIENKGWFFIFYVFSTIIIRLFTSKLSDKIGREVTLIIGVVVLFSSMIVLFISSSILVYTLASILFGIATGIISPGIFAWIADLAPITRRGVASGTLFIGLELGVMFGSFLTLSLYSNTLISLHNVFFVSIFFPIISFIYLFWKIIKKRR